MMNFTEGKRSRKPAMLMIRNLDPGVHERIRIQAATVGQSMEGFMRLFLAQSFPEANPVGFGTLVREQRQYMRTRGVSFDGVEFHRIESEPENPFAE